MTLLEMTQRILSSMDSDNVDSISDTVEATQVAYIIRDCYELMVVNSLIPEHYQMGVLVSPESTSYPNYFQYPTGCKQLDFIKYDIRGASDTASNYATIRYLKPHDFLDLVNQRNEDETNVDSVTDYGGIELLIQNDKAPQYWTSFDDNYIVFDSYDSAADASYVQASKTQARYSAVPTFTISDSFTPDIDDNLFPMLLQEAKSTAFIELKQQTHAKAEQQSRSQKAKYQNERRKFKAANKLEGPSYGRTNAQASGRILSQTSGGSGSNGGGVSDGDKGDITVSGSGAVWTIDDGVVTLAKMADLATSTILGRTTAGTGVPEALTASQVRSLINVEDGATADQTGSEIKTAYEAEADTNAFTDAEQTKLSGVETNADVTDETNVVSALDGATLTDVGTPASTDRILLQDASDSNNLKYADFSEFGGSGTVTSVAVSGSDGLEVDSGSPITTSGTIALGVNASTLRTHINVENGADVTDETNVTNSLDGATLTAVTVATGDKVLVQDVSDSDNLKTVTAQSIADLASGGGGKLVGFAIATTTTASSGSTTIPVDSTIPQNTEGNEIITVSYTPTNASNKLRIRYNGILGGNADEQATMALFQDSTADALKAGQFRCIGGANTAYERHLEHIMDAGTTSSTTFKIRAGLSTSTVYWNRNESTSDLYGTAAVTTLTVEEWEV